MPTQRIVVITDLKGISNQNQVAGDRQDNGATALNNRVSRAPVAASRYPGASFTIRSPAQAPTGANLADDESRTEL